MEDVGKIYLCIILTSICGIGKGTFLFKFKQKERHLYSLVENIVLGIQEEQQKKVYYTTYICGC